MKALSKKICRAIFSVCAAVCLVFGLAACAKEQPEVYLSADDSVSAVYTAAEKISSDGLGGGFSLEIADFSLVGRFCLSSESDGKNFTLETLKGGVQTAYYGDGGLFLNPEFAEEGVSLSANLLSAGISADIKSAAISEEGELEELLASVKGVKRGGRLEVSLSCGGQSLLSLLGSFGLPRLDLGINSAAVNLTLDEISDGNYELKSARIQASAAAGSFDLSFTAEKAVNIQKSQYVSINFAELDLCKELVKIRDEGKIALDFGSFDGDSRGEAEVDFDGVRAYISGRGAAEWGAGDFKLALELSVKVGSSGDSDKITFVYDGGAEEEPALISRVNGDELSLTRGQLNGLSGDITNLSPSGARQAAQPAASVTSEQPTDGAKFALKLIDGVLKLTFGELSLEAAGGNSTPMHGGVILSARGSGTDCAIAACADKYAQYYSGISSGLSDKSQVVSYTADGEPLQAVIDFAAAAFDGLKSISLFGDKVLCASVFVDGAGVADGFLMDADIYFGCNLPSYSHANGGAEEVVLLGNAAVINIKRLKVGGESLFSGSATAYYNGGVLTFAEGGSPIAKIETSTLVDDLSAFLQKISGKNSSPAAISSGGVSLSLGGALSLSFGFKNKSAFDGNSGDIYLFAPSSFPAV